MKRGVLILVVLLLMMSFVLAKPSKVELTLDKTTYSKNASFSGSLLVMDDDPLSVDVDVEYVIDDVSEVMTFQEFLDGYSGDVVLLPKSYETKGILGTSLSNLYKSEGGLKYIGKKLTDSYENLDSVSLKLTGDVYGLQVDFGDDGVVEWSAKGSRTGWDKKLVKDYWSDWLGDKIDPGQKKRCQKIELDFEGEYDELDVLITSKAQKQGLDMGVLSATVGSSSCEFSGVGVAWTDVTCQTTITKPVTGKDYNVCVEASKSGLYWLPSFEVDDDDHYFINMQVGVYDKHFVGANFELTGKDYVNALEDYMDECVYDEDDFCLLPIGFNASSGNLDVSSFVVENSRDAVNDGFWELTAESPMLDVSKGFSFDLEKLSFLRAPLELGEYDIWFDVDGEESSEVEFVVALGPTAKIEAESFGSIGRAVLFDGSGSTAVGDRTIVSYVWDFGDNSTLSGASASHSYVSEGNYTVTLTVTDSSGISDIATFVVSIGSLGDSLGGWLDDAVSGADASLERHKGNDSEAEIYTLLGYPLEVVGLKSNLSSLRTEFLSVQANSLMTSEAKEMEYSRIANEMDAIKKEVPSSLNLGLVETITGETVTGLADIPRSSLSSNYLDVNAYNIEIYNFNIKNVKADSEIIDVSISYLDGSKDDVKVVEKQVTAPGATLIVENMKGNTNFEVVSPVASSTSGGVIEWTGSSGKYVYLVLEGSQGVTVGFTTNVQLPGVVVPSAECGDDECTLGLEDEDSCPEDCKRERPWALLVVLFVIVVIGVFYLNFYKGPGNFKDLTNSISINLFHRRLFTNERDMGNLELYVKNTLSRGYSAEDVRKVLLVRGWTHDQIDFVMKKFK